MLVAISLAVVLTGGCSSFAKYTEPQAQGRPNEQVIRVFESGQVQIMAIDGARIADRNAFAGDRVLVFMPGERKLDGRITYNADIVAFSPSEGDFSLRGAFVAGRAYQIVVVRRTGIDDTFVISLFDVESDKLVDKATVTSQPSAKTR